MTFGNITPVIQAFNFTSPSSYLDTHPTRYLLGKHKAAIDVYEEAHKVGAEDWEIWHNKGCCFMYLKAYDKAIECFNNANSLQRHDTTFIQVKF